MDFIGVIVIIFVVIGLFSAAAQGKKKKQDGGEGRPAPRPTMSDIQRAFMMMSGAEDEQEEPKAPSAPAYSRPAAPVPPKSEPLRVFDEGNSDFGNVASGSMRGDFTRPASGSMRYDTPAISGQGFGVTPASFEGTQFEPLAARFELTENKPLGHRMDESVEIEDIAELKMQRELEQKNLKPTLKLFQGKGEFVKAIIYSEILAPRPQSRRSAR